MQALNRSIAAQIADLLFIPSQAEPRQVRAEPVATSESSAGSMSLAKRTVSTPPERIDVTPFNPLDGPARLICALLAGVSAIAVLGGTLAMMVS